MICSYMYVYTSPRQNTSESGVLSVVNVKISSDCKSDWTTVELQQPVEVRSIFQKQYVLFIVVCEPGTTTCAKIFEVMHINFRSVDLVH